MPPRSFSSRRAQVVRLPNGDRRRVEVLRSSERRYSQISPDSSTGVWFGGLPNLLGMLTAAGTPDPWCVSVQELPERGRRRDVWTECWYRTCESRGEADALAASVYDRLAWSGTVPDVPG